MYTSDKNKIKLEFEFHLSFGVKANKGIGLFI